MAGNRIFRGPTNRVPRAVAGTLASALKPGVMVTFDGSALTVATGSDDEGQLYILTNRDHTGQAPTTAYASGDTGSAYVPEDGLQFQCALAAATYAVGDALSVGASGYLEAAGAGDTIRAYFRDTAGVFTAGQLADVEIASGGPVQTA